MGKKANFGEEIITFPVDKLAVRNIHFPIMEIKSYPESNPKAFNDNRTFFITAETYIETPDGRVGYRDLMSDSIIYLNQLDTILDRGSLNRAVERIGKALIPTMQGGNNFEVKNWGIQSRDTLIQAFHDSATKGIYLNPNRGSKGIPGNIYELQSIFRHELIHYRDKDRWNNYNKKTSTFSFKDHADVYWEQMEYPEFKEMPPNSKVSVIIAYIMCHWNHAKKAQNENFADFNEAIENFRRQYGEKLQIEIEVIKKEKGDPKYVVIKTKEGKYTYDYTPFKSPMDLSIER